MILSTATNKLRKKGFKRFFLAILSSLYQIPTIRSIIRLTIPKKEPAKWVFLVGCYNSGTTITNKILSFHPDIQASIFGREGVHYTSHLPKPDDLGWARMWIKCEDYMNIDPDDELRAEKVKKDWRILWRGKEVVFIEKSITNITRMKWFDRHFKNSYFIGMTRNGYCVTEGIVRRAQPTHAPANLEHQGLYPIEWGSKQWVNANQHLLDGRSSVKNYMEFSYEDFTDNPIPILEGLWKFLDLPSPDMTFDNGLLKINEQQISLKNMNQYSLDRLGEEDKDKVSQTIEPMMKELGY
jgi:hypothetical protein